MLDKTKDPNGTISLVEIDAILPAAVKPTLLLKLSKGVLQVVLMAAILGGSVFAMTRLINSKPEPTARHAFRTIYTIKTAEVTRANHQPEFISYGQIAASRKVDLRSLVSGEVVSVSDKLQIGTRVAKGEALVEIDRFAYLGAQKEAQANLKETRARLDENQARIVSENSKLTSAKDQLAIAERDLERARSLRKNGTMTQQQVEARTLIVSQRQQSLNLSENMLMIEQARLGQQEAAIERLEWRLSQAARNLENTVLKAPFTGIVRSSAVDVGKLVSANDVVVSLYEPGNLEARFTLTDAQFGRLQNDLDGLIGRKVTITWNIGGQEVVYPGEIERIGADINSSRGGIEVFASLTNTDNPANIRPGAFVEILVPDKVYRKSVKLPDLAVYRGTYVYVMNDGQLNRRQVSIVAYDGENILISEGLEPGEKVLITRIAEVGEGLRVREENSKPQSVDEVKGPDRVSGNSGSQSGRPTGEELGAILAANKLTETEWKNLAPSERQHMVRTYRNSRGS